MTKTPLISGYEFTHFHYFTTRKRHDAASIRNSTVVSILRHACYSYRQNCSEAVPGNESSTTTASFCKSKHARSLETAKDCSATVSNNRANGSVTVELSASGYIIEKSTRVLQSVRSLNRLATTASMLTVRKLQKSQAQITPAV